MPIEDLQAGKLAIYELMAEESAVNYWEKYGNVRISVRTWLPCSARRFLTRKFPWYRWDADRVRRRPESCPHFLRPDQPVDPLAEA